MRFHVTHLDGGVDSNPPLQVLPELLAELVYSDDDHPDVSISDENGVTLSAFAGGGVVFENVETGEPPARHIDGLNGATVLKLFTALAQGRLDDVENQPWQPGYGS